MPKPRLLPCTSAPGSRSGVSAEVALGLDLQPRCWPCGVMGQTRRPRGALWQTWVEKPLRSRVSPAFFGCPLLPGLGSLIHSFARSLTPLGGGCCGKQGGLTFLLLPLAPWSCTCPSLCSPCGGEPGRPCGSGERGGGRGRCQWAAGITVETGDCPASPKRSGGAGSGLGSARSPQSCPLSPSNLISTPSLLWVITVASYLVPRTAPVAS